MLSDSNGQLSLNLVAAGKTTAVVKSPGSRETVFVCVEVLLPNQPNGVMSSAVFT